MTRATSRSLRARWVTACVVAEAVGMTASAGAARGATAMVDADVARAALLGFLVVLAGGLVEGTALGVLQSGALAERLGGRGRRAWVAVTLALAGLGWAVGSAPATLSADSGDSGASPPLAVVLVGAAGIGLVLGALLGAAQAWVLSRRAARPAGHPAQWVLGSALGWTVAMTVIFGGATTAGAGWAWPLVAGYGTVTGALAGLGLGVVTAPFLARLDSAPETPAPRDLGPEAESPRPVGTGGASP